MRRGDALGIGEEKVARLSGVGEVGRIFLLAKVPAVAVLTARLSCSSRLSACHAM